MTVRSGAQRARAARRLERAGADLVLLPAEEERTWWAQRGFRLPPAASFCRAHAPELLLALLARTGRTPEECVAALRGTGSEPELRRTAFALAPRVKSLVLPGGRVGEELAGALYGRFGIGGRTGDWGSAAAAVDFSPQPGAPPCPALRLYGPEPDLCGAVFCAPAADIFPDAGRLETLAALWDCGALEGKSLAIEWA